jgi:prepilin-type N-terminal cleavage/methylation domain-containing protein
MRSKITTKQSGFTIVEVVLVLAIAALIFLIVFLAVPQLRRARRDTQRQSDIGRLGAALEQYAATNNGAYPDTVTDSFVLNYLDGKFNDPSDGAYTGSARFRYDNGADCIGPDQETAARDVSAGGTAAPGARTWAVSMDLEGAPFICQQSQ